MPCWKWPCEPAEILACCYVVVYDDWRYYHDLDDVPLPGEWREKVEKFKKTFFRDGDVLLGYIVVFDRDNNICSILAVVLYGSDNPVVKRIVVDFVDVDEWLRFIEQQSANA